MKNLTLFQIAGLVVTTACSNSTGIHARPSQTPPPNQELSPEAGVPSTTAAPVEGAPLVKNEFTVPPSARNLVGGDTIRRRTGGYRFGVEQVPRIIFTNPELRQVLPTLRSTAQRFFAAGGALDAAARLANAPLDPESPLWQLATNDPKSVAFAVPESGVMVFQRQVAWNQQTPIRDASEAVYAALGAIADSQLLSVAPGETVDLIAVHARHMGLHGDSSAVSTKVGYKVFLGRVYDGIPVHGPATTVGLDSSGKLSFFRRGWREIAGIEGTIAVAPAEVVEARRDPLQVKFLAQQNVSCGYVEDESWSAVQNGPGIACAHEYLDPHGSDELGKQTVEWVNASADGSIPLHGEIPSRGN